MTPIRCHQCQRENPAGNSFCTYCGAPLVSSDAPPEEPSGGALQEGAGSLEAELREVRQELRQAGLLLDRLQDRISRLELGRARGAAPSQPPPSSTPTTPLPPSAVGATTPSPGGVTGGAAVPASPTVGSPPASPGVSGAGFAPPFGGISIDWEQVLGKNWFAIVGALALAIGAGFFLKLAFDNDWIGPIGRIALGIVLGMALLGAGEYSQRRVPLWAQPVTAGGIGILYLSIYAAFGLYQLVAPLPAFLFLGLVVVLSVLLALRYESLVIALLGIVGAFITPVLLGRDLPDPRLVLVYILVIDLGILGVSTFRNWRWFTLVGLAGSYGLFTLWLDQFPAQSALMVHAALTGVFLVFVGATSLFHILWRRAPGPVDLVLITLNAAGYYALTFGVLWPEYRLWFGGITLGLSLLYGVVAYAAIKRSGTPPEVALFALATAVVFLTVAVPLQLSGNWVSVAWAAEGAVLVGLGFFLVRWPMRAFGLGVLAVALFRLLIFDTWVDLEGFKPVLNDRFPTFVVAIVAFYVAAYLYWREREHLQVWEQYMAPALAGLANLVTLWLFTAEVIAYFDSQVLAHPFRQLGGPASPEDLERFTAAFSGYNLAVQAAENGKFLVLTAMWTVYAFGALSIGLAKRSAPLRWVGLGLLAIPALKLLLFDTFMVRLDPFSFLPVLNFHFLVFLIVLGVLLISAYLYRREGDRLTGRERYVFQALVVVANFVTIWVLSMEAIRFFDSQGAKLRADFFSAMHLTLTVLWAVYAIGVIGFGIARQSSRVRLAGMALLAIPVAKLFVFDIFLMERGYRVAAFVTLGGLLLATGLVYQRYSQTIRGFLFGRRA